MASDQDDSICLQVYVRVVYTLNQICCQSDRSESQIYLYTKSVFIKIPMRLSIICMCYNNKRTWHLCVLESVACCVHCSTQVVIYPILYNYTAFCVTTDSKHIKYKVSNTFICFYPCVSPRGALQSHTRLFVYLLLLCTAKSSKYQHNPSCTTTIF